MVFMSKILMPVANLRSREHYIASFTSLAQEILPHFTSLSEIEAQERQINRYPRLERLEAPRHIQVLEEDGLSAARLSRAKEAVVRGEILFEHAAAGEGTRLMLGPKYFLNISNGLNAESLAHVMSLDTGRVISPDTVAAELVCQPRDLFPFSLGNRHMLQLAYDLHRLALEFGQSPQEVLGRQHLLIIISGEMAARIEREFYQWQFFGFDPKQVYFMVQESFHGLSLMGGKFFYDLKSPRRLHNHGQMVLQQTMDQQLFTLTGHPRERTYHSQEAVADWLQAFSDKISYNIEDLDYLTGSLDFQALGLALELGDRGYHMVMEVVSNNPRKPQKGGMLAWDQELERDVMIESFQLGDIENQDIKYLNRNFNHYPRPGESWRRVREFGLPMPITVKDGYLYFQPVQGDINFLVNTAFFRRREIAPIRSLKGPAALPLAVNRMAAQDRQPGFQEFVRSCRQGVI
jgi:hypothetical protein